MKKLQFMAWPKLCTAVLLGTAALFTASCARDGFDNDEKFESSVRNAQLTPPVASKIDVKDSPDGSELVVTWPVVMGAGGYEVKQYDITSAGKDVLVKTANIDGCTVNMPREEDTKYRFEIRSLGNSALNNTSSTTSSKKEHSTIIDATDYIAPGDLAAYFTPDKLSSEVGDTLCYDLEPGGIYTMSANIDLGGHWVTFRSKDKNTNAILNLTSKTTFITYGGIILKYMDINASINEDGHALITLSSKPEGCKKTAENDYCIIPNPIGIQKCNIKNLPCRILNDKVEGDPKYAIEVLRIQNSIIQLNQSSTSSGQFILLNKSIPINFVIQNSTIYNSSAATNYYFAQIHGQEPAKLGTYSKAVFKFFNNTFYNLAKEQQFINTNTFKGKASVTFNWENNIFVNCGRKQIWDKLTNASAAKNVLTAKNNTYWFDGADANEKYDTAVLKTDPGFADPANGDFTISGAEQVAKGTGDPRWIK